jgi:hypothetical protein
MNYDKTPQPPSTPESPDLSPGRTLAMSRAKLWLKKAQFPGSGLFVGHFDPYLVCPAFSDNLQIQVIFM